MLAGAVGGVLLQAPDRAVTVGQALPRVAELLPGGGQIGMQFAHVQRGSRAGGEHEQPGGEFRGELAHAAAAPSALSAAGATGCDAYRS
ncbi:hypothetical protein WI38_07250 [Burkholderia ubonensis]|uniref:Uncharacterized protein n=1 Tax=Burkholderia ubonensis TaxID=101571 RepID=A0A102K0B3_9BURK|nr:hypothetical protein WI35_21515 [Burkholderia ubonensis]KUZ94435.1 hypothetical protein WI38_07250 [Burkholderia ubonensis]KUZ96808.1 hypothetical protein WI39_10305 [Burkholderia ubonensis]